jgi:type IV pilus assembly protein PilA
MPVQLIRQSKPPSGFTLAELLASITILIVLAAILINAYQTYIVREQVREGVRLANSLKPAIISHLQNHDVMPVSRTTLGLDKNPTDTANNYVKSVDVKNGRLDITFGNRANATIADAILYIVPYQMPDGYIIWRCGSAPLPTDAGGNELPLATSSLSSSPLAFAASNVPTRYRPDDCH